jgi:superfamily I DNA/RNA helicase
LNQVQKPQEQDASRTLPYRLTPELLASWRIPAELHHYFLGCETENQLENCGAPERYFLHLIDCLWPATAAEVVEQPNLLVQSPDDLSRYAAGDLLDFLLLLDADQERFVDWSLRGPTLVKGGPGSGKSTVAMYRVRALAQSRPPGEGKIRILFTTYTNPLVEFSRQLIERLLEGVQDRQIDLEVSTLDRVAWHLVDDHDGRPNMADGRDLNYALASARTAYSPQGGNPLESALVANALQALRDDYLLEEFEWVIEGQGLKELAEYQAADRTGRGYALDARMRAVVWTLHQHSERFLKTLGKTSWGALRGRALELARSLPVESKWDYVIIDEAQDLTPAALALCVELCKSPQCVFLTADASQSLYNRGFAWKNVHESLRVAGRTRLLKRNYRTTRQIAVAAASILKNTGAGDEEALEQMFVHVGPPPVIYEAADEVDVFIWLADSLTAAAQELHLPVSSIAVLAPQNTLAQQAASLLTECGLPTLYVSGKGINLMSPQAKALTIHSCKGLEFPIVAIPYVEAGLLPRNLPDERADDLEKHLHGERRLLFVGMTRAMRRLFVLYRRGMKSSFLDNIIDDLWCIKYFM